MFATVPKLPNSQFFQSVHLHLRPTRLKASVRARSPTQRRSINWSYNIHQQLFESLLNSTTWFTCGVGVKGTDKPGDIIKVCVELPYTACWRFSGVDPVWVLYIKAGIVRGFLQLGFSGVFLNDNIFFWKPIIWGPTKSGFIKFYCRFTKIGYIIRHCWKLSAD